MRKTLIKLGGYAKHNRLLNLGIRYNPLYYNPIRRLIRDVDRMGLSDRRALSERLLSRSLRWAKDTAAGSEIDQPFSGWPILEKEALRSNEEKFRKRTVITVPAMTGGTTGIPLRLWRSLRSVAAEQAFLDSLLEPFGITFRNARIANFRAMDIKSLSDHNPPFGKITDRGRHFLLSSRHVSKDTARWFCEAINDFAPDIVWSGPVSVERLARYALDQGLTMHIPLMLTSSEVLKQSARALLTQAFGAKVIDYYGLAERVAFASSMEENECYFNSAYGLVELRPVVGISLRPDWMYAEIIATGFWNESMPLLRYRTGDYVICPASYDKNDLEAVALGVKPFIGIAGREKEHLVTPRGENLIAINCLAWEATNIIRMQLVQESHHFVRINAISTPEFGARDREILYENFRQYLPDDMKVELCLVDELEVTASGKTPYVIRRFEQEEPRPDKL